VPVRLLADALRLSEPDRDGWFAASGLPHRTARRRGRPERNRRGPL